MEAKGLSSINSRKSSDRLRGIMNIFKRFWRLIYQTYRLVFRYPNLVLAETNYDAYWRDKRKEGMGTISRFQQQRADWILPRIEENSSVLDLGSGDGGVLSYLMSKRPIEPTGADISDYALEFLTAQGIAAVKFDLSDLTQISSLPEVDYIILFEILEHIPNPEKLLELIEPKARKALFISFPNSGYFAYRLRLLMGSFIMQWRLHPGEHLRFWTYRDLKWWLRQLGYANRAKVHIYEGIPFLSRLWGSMFGMGFVFEIKTTKSPNL